jgi:hypothetical protein
MLVTHTEKYYYVCLKSARDSGTKLEIPCPTILHRILKLALTDKHPFNRRAPVFYTVMPRSSETARRFGVTLYLHFQGKKEMRRPGFYPEDGGDVPPKRRALSELGTPNSSYWPP